VRRREPGFINDRASLIRSVAPQDGISMSGVGCVVRILPPITLTISFRFTIFISVLRKIPVELRSALLMATGL
jgi:hypothetical protein